MVLKVKKDTGKQVLKVKKNNRETGYSPSQSSGSRYQRFFFLF